MFIAVLVFILLIAADQATKLLFFGREIPLIPGVIGLSSPGGLNTGMAWGLLGGKTGSVIFLSVVTVLTLALLVYVFIRYRREMPMAIKLAFALIAGGAVGNLIDRIALGGVRDFIRTQFMDFPYFNVADIGVTVGGFLLAATLLFTKAGRSFAALVFGEDKKAAADEPLPTDDKIMPEEKEALPTDDDNDEDIGE